ncbi:MAG: hypothetical protein WAO91_08890 [Candidatus Nitrosotenuis sp.]
MGYFWLFLVLSVLFSGSNLVSYSFASSTTVQTDKTMYFARDTIILDGTVEQLVKDLDNVRIEFVNPNDKIISEQNVKLDKDRLTFRTSISLVENYWNTEGLYRIKVSYGDQHASSYFHFFQSSSGIPQVILSTIGLDKRHYTWTDSVEIFVVAPSFNKNNQVDYIGSGGDFGKIEIKTGKGKLENYQLIETAGNSGIFKGNVVLTGDSRVDADGNGQAYEAEEITSGSGPSGGKLAAGKRDVIKVTFSNSKESVSDLANIDWTRGEILWYFDVAEPRSEVTISVKDPDMNIKQNIPDYLNVLVWSNTDKKPKIIRLAETTGNSGVFEKLILLSDQSGSSRIKAVDKDTLYVRYEDRTAPSDLKSTIVSVDSSIPIHSADSIQSTTTPKTPKTNPTTSENYEKSATSESFGSLSVDSSRYKVFHGKSTMVKIEGTVKWQTKGSTVYLTIQDPNGKSQELKALVGNTKKFTAYLNLNPDSPTGKYVVSATYGDAGQTIGFEVVKNTDLSIDKYKTKDPIKKSTKITKKIK